jgi:geranyl-CoA carboxylase alpha subunit
VLTLDAMKMEHVHAAPVTGRVKSLNAAMGDQVAVYRVIAEIEQAA